VAFKLDSEAWVLKERDEIRDR